MSQDQPNSAMIDPPKVAGPAADDLPGEEFQQLAASLEDLPAALAPDRDLWPGVAAHLEPRRRRWFSSRGVRAVGYRPLALAAALGLVAGAVLTWLAMGGDADRLAGPELSSASVPNAAVQSGLRAASTASVDLARVESQFLRAKEELWLAAFARRDELLPEAWQVVQQNLQILDAAISNLRSALSEDPGNGALQQRLLRNQRRSLDLLQDLTRDAGDAPLKDTV